MMRQVIGLLARSFPRVEIHCQSGNHGRNKLRHEGRATVSKWDSYETILYKSLEMMSCDLKNVSWDIPKAPWCVIPVFDKWMLQTHGDTELKLGPPGKQAALYEVALNQMNSNMTYGHHIDLLVNGHFHEPFVMRFKRGAALVNGALVPANGHAQAQGYDTACGQYIFESTPGFILGDERFIEVGPTQDGDASLSKVIPTPEF
jgi:hypothetical protein